MRLIGFVVLTLSAGCATTVQPEDMSAQSHRAEAARERQLARDHIDKYDPRALTPTPGVSVGDLRSGYDVSIGLVQYNPTHGQIEVAERHLIHAREHEAAAADLESFEATECKNLAPKTRAACPTLGPASQIEDLANGVRIHFPAGTDVDAVVEHMRCHLAFARARGFTTVGDCPLYIKGIEINQAADGAAVDVTGASRRVAGEIQVRTRVGVRP